MMKLSLNLEKKETVNKLNLSINTSIINYLLQTSSFSIFKLINFLSLILNKHAFFISKTVLIYLRYLLNNMFLK